MEDWASPGAYEVTPGVHRVPLPLPAVGLRAVNVYVVADPSGLVVVDSGWATSESREALGAGQARPDLPGGWPRPGGGGPPPSDGGITGGVPFLVIWRDASGDRAA